jgi:hypothetical protein
MAHILQISHFKTEMASKPEKNSCRRGKNIGNDSVQPLDTAFVYVRLLRRSPMEDNLYEAIKDLEKLCQEKLLVFQKLLSVFRKERKAIIKADVSSLWTFSKEKHELAMEIGGKREKILETAKSAGLIGQDDEYSLVRILSALKSKDKGTLVNLNMALNEMKRKIAALSHENRVYLEESLKTIEDLVHIITRSTLREERYGRENYLRPATHAYSRMAAMREGV